VGPGINPYATSESFRLIRQFGDGSLKMGVPRFGVGVVDVRDLAEAHLKAAFIPAAKGRYIVSGHDTDFFEMASVLRDRYGADYPIPKRPMPKWLVWLAGPLVNRAMTRRIVSLNVDRPWKADNSKGIRELALTYRPLQDSMLDFFQQMIDSGYLRGVGAAQ
jgi:dihydroflavonol-4-reductase